MGGANEIIGETIGERAIQARDEPWMVCFCNPDPPEPETDWRMKAIHGALKLLRRGFRHVFALREVEGGWLMLNPASSGLDVEFLPRHALVGSGPYRIHDWVEGIEQQIAVGAVHAVWVKPRRPGPMRPRLFFSCVGAVKAVLGLRGYAVTPWQLYRQLRREV